MSDHIGAKLTYPALPEHARTIIGDKGYDSDEYRAALKAKGITPCIPPRKGRILRADFDKNLYRQRHKIENMFGRLKDWRRVHTRYDRCAHTFLSAITIAATVIFWLS
jgi:transposase